MPPFVMAVLANMAAGFASAPASARIRAMLAQSGRPTGPRVNVRTAPQLPEPRVTLTPPVSPGPPVPAARPGTAASIAAALAARR